MTSNSLFGTSPELLMPAGSVQKLEYAFAYGADAVYVGVPFFSLRARENEFALEALQKGIERAHSLGKRIYVTANIFSRNRKIAPFERHFEDWVQLRPDAFIMSDPGLIATVREKYSDVPIHLSVQANCMNWRAVKFWKDSLQIGRIILSRELNLDEIREIHERVPEMELEAFVHGAICIAYSGRCLLSSYFSYRDANQGVCDNSCREKYNVYTSPRSPEELHHQDHFIEDRRSPGEFYKVEEDENGTYIMNAKDLALIRHLKKIQEAGVCSFKVEGRTKSIYYLSLVTRAYRRAIDDMMEGKEFNDVLGQELEKVSNRGYSTGFMIPPSEVSSVPSLPPSYPSPGQAFDLPSDLHQASHLDPILDRPTGDPHPGPEAQLYDTSKPRQFTQRYVGLFMHHERIPKGYFCIEARGRAAPGDLCEILGPQMQTGRYILREVLNPQLRPLNGVHPGAGPCFVKLEVLGSDGGEKGPSLTPTPPGSFSILSAIIASH